MLNINLEKKTEISFNVPDFWCALDADIVLNNISTMAMCAFYLYGNDQMGLCKIVDDSDMTIEEYNPINTYMECFDELIDVVCGYNYYLKENNINEPLIEIVVDEEKTEMLSTSSKFSIYKVVKKIA